MLKKWIFCVFLSLASLAFFSAANAAELRGKLSGVAGALVAVNCSGSKGSAVIDQSGNYAVRGLPAGRDCLFTVSQGDAKSVSIPFSTARSVTVYSGILSRHGKRILVLRQ